MEDSVIPIWFFFPCKCLQCFLFPGFVALELRSQVQTEPLSVHIDPVTRTTGKVLRENCAEMGSIGGRNSRISEKGS